MFFFIHVTCQDNVMKIIMLITPTALNRTFDVNVKLPKPYRFLHRNITCIIPTIQECTRFGDTCPIILPTSICKSATWVV